MKKTVMDPGAHSRPIRYSTPVSGVGDPLPEKQGPTPIREQSAVSSQS